MFTVNFWIKLKRDYVVYDVAYASGIVNAGDHCFHLTSTRCLFEASLLFKNIRYQNFDNGRRGSVDDILPFLFLSQAIKDIHLLSIVAGLLAVDVVFLSCWIAIDPLQAEILEYNHMVRH